MARLEYCPRCQESWNANAGYHICGESMAVVAERAREALRKAFPVEKLEELAQRQQERFVKHDKDKEVYAYIPEGFEEAIAKVLTYGASNPPGRTVDNWKNCPTPWRTYYSALRRHLAAAGRGERADSDSGESHLAHAACCLAFLWWFEREGKLHPSPAVDGEDPPVHSETQPRPGVG